MSILSKIGLITVVVLVSGLCMNAVQQEPETVAGKEIEKSVKDYYVYAIPLPESMDFAGERVPLENPDIRERLDRELLVNTYWQSNGLPASMQLTWPGPIELSTVEIKCDTNVKRNIMMRKDSKVSATFWNDVPQELLKSLELEAKVNGKWIPLGSIEKNRTRLIRFTFDTIKAAAVRIVMKQTYGFENTKLFEVRCYA